MYRKFKEQEENENSTIIKVLPGIEFSVEFDTEETGSNVVHVIAIFDDEDDAKVSRISELVKDESGMPKYDREMAFSEERF